VLRSFQISHDHSRNMPKKADFSVASVLPDDFVDRFAIVGGPQRCADRFREIMSLGVDRILVLTRVPTTDREEGNAARPPTRCSPGSPDTRQRKPAWTACDERSAAGVRSSSARDLAAISRTRRRGATRRKDPCMASGELAAHDGTTIALATWAAGLRREAIPPAAAHALVWHHLDSVGCAVGAIGAPPCIAVRALAAEGATQAAQAGVSVVGLANRVSAEIGAFANASMVRYLDYNDNYLRTGGGHTSDLIATLWALAELRGASGSDLLVGLHAGYETFAALADAVPLRDRGWDYPLFIGIAAAVGGAALLGLNIEQAANAISMAVTPAVPLGVTRAGQLSNWKGLASPFSAMTGLLAVRLAARGITGPPRAIDGVRGLWSLVTGEFSVGALGQPAGGLSAAERSAYKPSVSPRRDPKPRPRRCPERRCRRRSRSTGR
jgi:hypothetical protein